jgi:hypothetical protein
MLNISENLSDMLKNVVIYNNVVPNNISILQEDQKDLRYGQIYIITCKNTSTQYVGQVVSHRKNKNKYRWYGYLGRFNGHISEALKNTKKSVCTYLNSAIRCYSPESFTVKLLECCPLENLDERERHYIKQYNTLAPNGYNLTTGGKTVNWKNEYAEKIKKNPVIKRGRDFGFKHTEETKQKMKDYFVTISKEEMDKKKDTLRNVASNFFEQKRVDMLLNVGVEFDKDFAKYIRPRMKDNEIIGYVIRINRNRHGEISNKNLPLDIKYQMLYDALESAYKIQQQKKNQQEAKTLEGNV